MSDALRDAPVRPGAWERRTLQSWDPLQVLALVLLGAAAGAAVVLTGPSEGVHMRFTRSDGFLVWLVTICVQTAFWSVVTLPLWREVIDLHRDTAPSRRLMVLPFLITAALAVLIVSRLGTQRPDSPLWAHHPKMAFLTLFAAVGVGLPALHAIALVQDRVRRHSPDKLTQADLRVAVVARDYIKRYLGIAGAVIGLAVLAAGALRRAVLLFDPGGGSIRAAPAEAVLLYGAFFTALLLVVYVPAHLTLQRLCVDLREFHFPVAGMPAPTTSEFKEWMDGRARIDTLTQAQVSPLQQLQSSLFILAPLLSGVLGAFLPKVI
ncbi:hypothetical protein [Ornithinimicrobium cerasi]|uniref:hypothetical protein n=1 Tax=Ornithinimicrobium cerasi TaxID=2248773 RepID=UPI00137A5F63|nr:hypothetical protein [Ornithinimicrobium cerasi]